jgi:hypothetical protein
LDRPQGPTTRPMPSASTRKRRSTQEIIADLEGQIAKIRGRAEQRKAKKDPTLRHIGAARRSIDKALAAAEDGATRRALDEARATLSALLSLNGAAADPGARGMKVRARRAGTVEAAGVLKFIAGHPGSRCEDLANALGADSKELSSVLRNLRADGQVRTEGMARGMRYFADSGR